MTSSDDRTPEEKPASDLRATAHPEAAVAQPIPEAPLPLRRSAYGLTDLGRKRSSNEDAFFVDDALGLYIVADGMGGHAAGEVASREAVDTLHGMVKRGIRGLPELADPLSDDSSRAACRLMESAVQAATYFVYSIAEIDREKSGMGTTISALLILGAYAITAQVGDSRIYRIERNVVEQLTEDHTLIAWQLKQGLITPQEAARSPHRNVITRAVGNREYVQVDTRSVHLARGMRFLLCSDGLHGYLKDDDIPPIVGIGGPQAVERFIALANERGGKDNITAVLVAID
ncbi:MAG: protein phosphatase 2C domain-containing protein [Myxococcota bacterium]|nr:protein phosphatase 2C domain-containing protein [Myxococcota bacterium]